MDDALTRELENLRAENQILRDSLVEYRREEPKEDKTLEAVLRDAASKLGATAEQVRTNLSPGAEKLTAGLSRQLAENPVPVLLAAFGAGYLLSRALDRR